LQQNRILRHPQRPAGPYRLGLSSRWDREHLPRHASVVQDIRRILDHPGNGTGVRRMVEVLNHGLEDPAELLDRPRQPFQICQRALHDLP
jgi:hypothetical protein